MKALIFTLLIALSFVLEVVLISMSKDISQRTPQIISKIILAVSLVYTLCTFIIWGINPCQEYIKIPIIMHSLNIGIKLISTIVFSVFYYTENYVSSLYVILSYLIFMVSFILPFVFNDNSSTISPQNIQPIQEVIIQEEVKPDIKISVFTSNEPSSCTICLEPFIQDETVNETNCGHFYHKNCMDTLINNKIKNCPVCRANLYEKYDSIV